MLKLASRRDKSGRSLRFQSAGAAGIVPHPKAVEGLSVWLDASQLTGLANNDPVSTWNDLSANAAAFTQATSGNRPVYKTAQINGLPAVSFNGSSQSLTSNSNSLLVPFTAFAVVKAAGTTGTFWGSTPLYGFLWRYDSSKYQLLSSYIALVGQSTSNIDTNAHILSCSYDNRNWSLEKDAAADGSGANPQAIAPGTNVLGRDGYGSSGYWNGIIAELIGYDRVLSPTERASITGYLKSKYAI